MSMERFIEAWTERLRREIQGTVAIILKGSHARGFAGPWSDLDFDVLVFDEEIADRYLSRIEENDEGRLVHVSVAVASVEGWLEEFDEAASWSFGLPAMRRPGSSGSGGHRLPRNSTNHSGTTRPASRNSKTSSKVSARRAMRIAAGTNSPCGWRSRTWHPFAPRCLCRSTIRCRQFPAPGRNRCGPRSISRLRRPGTGTICSCVSALTGLASTPDVLLAAAERLVSGTLGLLEANADTLGPLLAPELPEQLSTRRAPALPGAANRTT